MADLISVIVTTYNRPDALNAVLRALHRQTDRNFEIIVADDGSGPDTAALVAQWRLQTGPRVKHVWHEDRGFRAAEIRNRGILESAGDLCIFLDGDCVPRSSFVAAHRRLAELGWFVAGNRVLLSRTLTDQALARGEEIEKWSLANWMRRRFSGDINRFAPLISLHLGALRRLKADDWRGVRSANLAVRRDDLLRLDGFDAAFAGWGLEDSDVVIRLLRAGVKRKDGRFATGVLHLWHPENDRSRLAANALRLREIEASGRVRAKEGLSSLQNEFAVRRTPAQRAQRSADGTS